MTPNKTTRSCKIDWNKLNGLIKKIEVKAEVRGFEKAIKCLEDILKDESMIPSFQREGYSVAVLDLKSLLPLPPKE